MACYYLLFYFFVYKDCLEFSICEAETYFAVECDSILFILILIAIELGNTELLLDYILYESRLERGLFDELLVNLFEF